MTLFRLALLLALPLSLSAQTTPATPTSPAAGAAEDLGAGTNPSYRIAAQDTISVNVRDEPDLAVVQRIDNTGVIRVPLLGDISVGGRTVREAERFLEQQLKEREYLIDPQVAITVVTFAPRELSVIGEVRSPGIFRFPPETTELDIVDLITKMGGFTPTAKGWEVKVSRTDASGATVEHTVDVNAIMSGKTRANDGRRESFTVLPGDRVRVLQRIF